MRLCARSWASELPTDSRWSRSAGAILRRLKPAKSSSVAISGLGAVGAGALFAAKYLGIETIILLDVVPGKLDMAKEFGATHTFNARDADVVEQVRKATDGGVDYFVECSGNVRALEAGWAMTANLGTLLSCGTPGPGVNPPFGIFENLVACVRLRCPVLLILDAAHANLLSRACRKPTLASARATRIRPNLSRSSPSCTPRATSLWTASPRRTRTRTLTKRCTTCASSARFCLAPTLRKVLTQGLSRHTHVHRHSGEVIKPIIVFKED